MYIELYMSLSCCILKDFDLSMLRQKINKTSLLSMMVRHTYTVFGPIVLLYSILATSHGFEITESSIYTNDTKLNGKNLTYIPGETVKLKCVTSDWYEYCTWKHNNDFCKFEWKRSYGKVRKQKCDTNWNERIEFLGNYNENECSIELSNLTLSDAGEWTCDLESYVWGPISGTRDTAGFNLMIDSDLDYNETFIDASAENDEENEGKHT